jgi:hypothetical protein
MDVGYRMKALVDAPGYHGVAAGILTNINSFWK